MGEMCIAPDDPDSLVRVLAGAPALRTLRRAYLPETVNSLLDEPLLLHGRVQTFELTQPTALDVPVSVEGVAPEVVNVALVVDVLDVAGSSADVPDRLLVPVPFWAAGQPADLDRIASSFIDALDFAASDRQEVLVYARSFDDGAVKVRDIYGFPDPLTLVVVRDDGTLVSSDPVVELDGRLTDGGTDTIDAAFAAF